MLLNTVSYNRFYFIILFLIFIILISTYINFQYYPYFNTIKQVKTKNFFYQQSSKLNHSLIQRAILVYYPSKQEIYYIPEIRWLYRSWIEILKYQSKQWRTDLIIFTEQYSLSLIQLGCIANQIRTNNKEQSKCRVFIYLPLSARHKNSSTEQILFTNDSIETLYQINISRSNLLYEYMKTYQYIDSVNIISESYPIYSHYDFILKTDLDVFLTKKFANSIPNTLKTLFVGQGGYSTEFNTRRLGRIAKNMNWKYQNLINIGSTWYGSPYIAQRIANLTLDAMIYLSINEFCRAEREQKLAGLLWPDWHYGVLSMYGTHLAVNHLINEEKLDIQNGSQILDQSTTNTNENNVEKNNILHLHCWHTDQQFSKFQFKANKYNHMHPNTFINDSSSQGYAMQMALESRSMTLNELAQYLLDIHNNNNNNNTNSNVFIMPPNIFPTFPSE